MEGNVFSRWSSRAHLEGSRVRAVALGDGLGPAAPLLVALSFGHSAIFYYTTAVTTRAARWKQAGRPLQGTAFPSQWTGSSPVVGWGSSSAQGETAVTPIFDSDTCVSRVFLPFSAAWGTGYAQAPCSRTCLSFPPTGSLFCGVVFLPTLPRWRLMTPRRPRPTGSGLRLLCWWRSLLGILPYFTILLQ